jgi:2-keto-4-pentenoate hydratase/2-oxohepta-3-ene-1,7-dioic acid hydratase in catechol pathway
VQHEVELAVLVGSRLRRASPDAASQAVAGYAAFLDITARDLQAAAKKAGQPWTLAKGIDTFAPCGAFAPAREVPEPDRLELALAVNGTVRQKGRTSDMIHGIGALLSHASRYMTLEAGDVLATGTPAGVGPIRAGDVLEATVGSLPPLRVQAVAVA